MTSTGLRVPTTYNNESSITCLVSANVVRVGVSTVTSFLVHGHQKGLPL